MTKIFFAVLLSLFLGNLSFSQTKPYIKKNFERKNYSKTIGASYLLFQKKFLDSILFSKSPLLAFESDTTFTADSIQKYDLGYDWKVFLIRGKFLPSEAEYHLYGIKKNNFFLECELYTMPVEIETILEKYLMNKNKIIIYGRQWDDSGLDDGSKPPKKLQILLQYP